MDLKIALLPGDGIGPEIIEQAVLISDKIAHKFNHSITWKHGLVGAAAIEDCGNPYPEKTHKICLEADAILSGAIIPPLAPISILRLHTVILPSIDLTARSGRAALKHRLSILGFKLTKFEMETIYADFLTLADEKKLLHDEDLYEIMEKKNGK